MIEKVFIVALLATFFLTLARKWGGIEYLQVWGNDFFSRMAHCNFCLSFWANVVVSLIALLFSGDVTYLVIPFVATPITRYLL